MITDKYFEPQYNFLYFSTDMEVLSNSHWSQNWLIQLSFPFSADLVASEIYITYFEDQCAYDSSESGSGEIVGTSTSDNGSVSFFIRFTELEFVSGGFYELKFKFQKSPDVSGMTDPIGIALVSSEKTGRITFAENLEFASLYVHTKAADEQAVEDETSTAEFTKSQSMNTTFVASFGVTAVYDSYTLVIGLSGEYTIEDSDCSSQKDQALGYLELPSFYCELDSVGNYIMFILEEPMAAGSQYKVSINLKSPEYFGSSTVSVLLLERYAPIVLSYGIIQNAFEIVAEQITPKLFYSFGINSEENYPIGVGIMADSSKDSCYKIMNSVRVEFELETDLYIDSGVFVQVGLGSSSIRLPIGYITHNLDVDEESASSVSIQMSEDNSALILRSVRFEAAKTYYVDFKINFYDSSASIWSGESSLGSIKIKSELTSSEIFYGEPGISTKMSELFEGTEVIKFGSKGTRMPLNHFKNKESSVYFDIVNNEQACASFAPIALIPKKNLETAYSAYSELDDTLTSSDGLFSDDFFEMNKYLRAMKMTFPSNEFNGAFYLGADDDLALTLTASFSRQFFQTSLEEKDPGKYLLELITTPALEATTDDSNDKIPEACGYIFETMTGSHLTPSTKTLSQFEKAFYWTGMDPKEYNGKIYSDWNIYHYIQYYPNTTCHLNTSTDNATSRMTSIRMGLSVQEISDGTTDELYLKHFTRTDQKLFWFSKFTAPSTANFAVGSEEDTDVVLMDFFIRFYYEIESSFNLYSDSSNRLSVANLNMMYSLPILNYQQALPNLENCLDPGKYCTFDSSLIPFLGESNKMKLMFRPWENLESKDSPTLLYLLVNLESYPIKSKSKVTIRIFFEGFDPLFASEDDSSDINTIYCESETQERWCTYNEGLEGTTTFGEYLNPLTRSSIDITTYGKETLEVAIPIMIREMDEKYQDFIGGGLDILVLKDTEIIDSYKAINYEVLLNNRLSTWSLFEKYSMASDFSFNFLRTSKYLVPTPDSDSYWISKLDGSSSTVVIDDLEEELKIDSKIQIGLDAFRQFSDGGAYDALFKNGLLICSSYDFFGSGFYMENDDKNHDIMNVKFVRGTDHTGSPVVIYCSLSKFDSSGKVEIKGKNFKLPYSGLAFPSYTNIYVSFQEYSSNFEKQSWLINTKTDLNEHVSWELEEIEAYLVDAPVWKYDANFIVYFEIPISLKGEGKMMFEVKEGENLFYATENEEYLECYLSFSQDDDIPCSVALVNSEFVVTITSPDAELPKNTEIELIISGLNTEEETEESSCVFLFEIQDQYKKKMMQTTLTQRFYYSTLESGDASNQDLTISVVPEHSFAALTNSVKVSMSFPSTLSLDDSIGYKISLAKNAVGFENSTCLVANTKGVILSSFETCAINEDLEIELKVSSTIEDFERNVYEIDLLLQNVELFEGNNYEETNELKLEVIYAEDTIMMAIEETFGDITACDGFPTDFAIKPYAYMLGSKGGIKLSFTNNGVYDSEGVFYVKFPRKVRPLSPYCFSAGIKGAKSIDSDLISVQCWLIDEDEFIVAFSLDEDDIMSNIQANIIIMSTVFTSYDDPNDFKFMVAYSSNGKEFPDFTYAASFTMESPTIIELSEIPYLNLESLTFETVSQGQSGQFSMSINFPEGVSEDQVVDFRNDIFLETGFQIDDQVSCSFMKVSSGDSSDSDSGSISSSSSDFGGSSSSDGSGSDSQIVSNDESSKTTYGSSISQYCHFIGDRLRVYLRSSASAGTYFLSVESLRNPNIPSSESCILITDIDAQVLSSDKTHVIMSSVKLLLDSSIEYIVNSDENASRTIKVRTVEAEEELYLGVYQQIKVETVNSDNFEKFVRIRLGEGNQSGFFLKNEDESDHYVGVGCSYKTMLMGAEFSLAEDGYTIKIEKEEYSSDSSASSYYLTPLSLGVCLTKKKIVLQSSQNIVIYSGVTNPPIMVSSSYYPVSLVYFYITVESMNLDGSFDFEITSESVFKLDSTKRREFISVNGLGTSKSKSLGKLVIRSESGLYQEHGVVLNVQGTKENFGRHSPATIQAGEVDKHWFELEINSVVSVGFYIAVSEVLDYLSLSKEKLKELVLSGQENYKGIKLFYVNTYGATQTLEVSGLLASTKYIVTAYFEGPYDISGSREFSVKTDDKTSIMGQFDMAFYSGLSEEEEKTALCRLCEGFVMPYDSMWTTYGTRCEEDPSFEESTSSDFVENKESYADSRRRLFDRSTADYSTLQGSTLSIYVLPNRKECESDISSVSMKIRLSSSTKVDDFSEILTTFPGIYDISDLETFEIREQEIVNSIQVYAGSTTVTFTSLELQDPGKFYGVLLDKQGTSVTYAEIYYQQIEGAVEYWEQVSEGDNYMYSAYFEGLEPNHLYSFHLFGNTIDQRMTIPSDIMTIEFATTADGSTE